MKTGRWVERYEVASTSDSEKSYIVSKSDTGFWGCSCAAWKFQRAPKSDCKHIDSVKDDLRNGIAITEPVTMQSNKKEFVRMSVVSASTGKAVLEKKEFVVRRRFDLE